LIDILLSYANERLGDHSVRRGDLLHPADAFSTRHYRGGGEDDPKLILHRLEPAMPPAIS
jgi:hypothetical protein